MIRTTPHPVMMARPMINPHPSPAVLVNSAVNFAPATSLHHSHGLNPLRSQPTPKITSANQSICFSTSESCEEPIRCKRQPESFLMGCQKLNSSVEYKRQMEITANRKAKVAASTNPQHATTYDEMFNFMNHAKRTHRKGSCGAKHMVPKNAPIANNSAISCNR